MVEGESQEEGEWGMGYLYERTDETRGVENHTLVSGSTNGNAGSERTGVICRMPQAEMPVCRSPSDHDSR